MIDPRDSKTWQNRHILIRNLKNRVSDLEWNGEYEIANALIEQIEQLTKEIETEGDLIVPF